MHEQPNISRLTLGTVQLGLPYGVANREGQPSEEASHALLQHALHEGITTLDTARIYGNAEQVIGAFNHHEQFTIVSKFKLSQAALSDVQLAISEARTSIQASCQMLNLDALHLVLFHKDKDQPMAQTAVVLPQVLKALQSEGLIHAGGISVYNANELKEINDWQWIRAVQVPFNVLDTRLLQPDVEQALLTNKITVFARSIYLQGLLTFESPLPEHLSFATSYLQKLQGMAAKAQRTVKDLAFAFVRDTAAVSSIVIGAETLAQLQENIGFLHTPPLHKELYEEIMNSFAGLPEHIITPALWNK